MTNPAIHLEALDPVAGHQLHPIELHGRRMISLMCLPGACENMEKIKRQIRLALSANVEPAVIFPCAAQMVTYQPRADIRSADPQPMVGPNAEERCKAMERGYYHTGDLVGVMERMFRPLRQANLLDAIRLIWIDAEHLWTAQAKESDYPGLRFLLPQVFPGESVERWEHRERIAVHNGLRRACEFVGIDPAKLCVFACADREFRIMPQWAPVPPLGVPVGKSHIIATDYSQDTTDGLRATLRAGSGPETCVVHLRTSTPPNVNKDRLTICREEGVRDIILFVDQQDPSKPDAVTAQEQAEAIVDRRRFLDAQVVVFG